jgi:hypothetical protein
MAGRIERHPYLVALAGYVSLAAVFYLPILLGRRTFPQSDLTDYFLPLSTFLRDELLAGRLPLWNPHTFAGHPFLANLEAGTFYPVGDLLLGLSLPWDSPQARLYWLQLDAVLHIVLAGFFTYLLVSDLVRRRPAAFLAGCVFAFSGYLTGYPPLQLNIIRTAVWLPLLLWLLRRAFARTEGWRWWIAAALAYATAFLAGHPQTFLYISYVSLAWILYLAATSRCRRLTCLSRVCLFYLLAAALSAAQWWPSLEMARVSIRAGASYEFAGVGLALRDTAQLFLPAVLSRFSPLYVGLPGLALALLASEYPSQARAGWQSDVRKDTRPPGKPATGGRGPIFFFASLATVALLLSYGHNGFIYPVIFRWLPGWDLFRNQERSAYLVALALSVLAGYGAVAVTALTVRRRRIAGITFTGVAATCVTVIAILGHRKGGLATSQARLTWVAVAAAVVLLAWSLLLWSGRWRRRHSALVVTLVVADLFAANVATNLGRFDATPAPEALAVQAAVRADSVSNPGLPGRVHNEHRIPADYGVGLAVDEVRGFSQMRLARYESLFDGFPMSRLWRLTGVEYVLTWREPPRMPQADLLDWFPGTDGATYLYGLRSSNPRAWVASDVRIVGDAEALGLLADPSFDLENTALMPSSGDGAADPRLFHGEFPVQRGEDEVRLRRLSPNRLGALVRAEHGGLLVISENWMPGWQATRYDPGAGSGSGEPLQVMRADLTFLGIAIPPGESEIELVYRPASVRYGLLTSGTALILLGLFGLARWLGRHRNWAVGGEE